MKYLWLCLLPAFIFATANRDLFQKFPNRYFVETGSNSGEGIAQALRAGFAEIHSVELSEKYYGECQKRFAGNSKVHLWLGDSSKLLEKMIAGIDQPITFWLDGHWSYGLTARGDVNTPILQELETIRKHRIKTHTILIDDVRLFGTKSFDEIPLSMVTQKIYEINSRYVISYEKGFQENDILVAKIIDK